MDSNSPQTPTADHEAIRADLRETAKLQKKVQRRMNEMVKENKERQKEAGTIDIYPLESLVGLGNT